MRYRSLNDELKKHYGKKVYKIALSSGCSCPNRDGTIGSRGCIFCDGSGAFAEHGSVAQQLQKAKERIASKAGENPGYVAYFQSFTNTYGPTEILEPMFLEAMEDEAVVALSIATRPDCLGPEILSMLERLRERKPVWIELGLQTIHERTARLIRRGYPLEVFDEAVAACRKRELLVIVHQILGLPGESREDMLETTRYIGRSGAEGIKFHLLHVLDGTDLAELWREGKVPEMSMEEYFELLADCISVLPSEVTVHRLTGDGAKKDLLSPLWTGDKKRVLNSMKQYFELHDLHQGSAL